MLKRIIAFFKKLFGFGSKTIVPKSSEGLFGPLKQKAVVGNLIRVCPGKRHAWFESNLGPIRKPL